MLHQHVLADKTDHDRPPEDHLYAGRSLRTEVSNRLFERRDLPITATMSPSRKIFVTVESIALLMRTAATTTTGERSLSISITGSVSRLARKRVHRNGSIFSRYFYLISSPQGKGGYYNCHLDGHCLLHSTKDSNTLAASTTLTAPPMLVLLGL